MAAAAAAAPADGAPAPDPGPDPAVRPPPKGAGLTKLCPSCGVRRPTFHFIRRNGKSFRNLVMNCATCRGFQPRDPRIAVNNADGGDADGDGDVDVLDNDGVDDDDDDSDDSDYDPDAGGDADRALAIRNGGTRGRTRHGANGGDPSSSDDSGDDSDNSNSDNGRRPGRDDGGARRRHHHRRHRHAGGARVRLRDESEWVLTGLGVVLYFFGWFSIVALFVVIVAF